jgi:hypothetical protein
VTPNDDLARKVDYLQHQNTTLLVLSAINMFMNIATICVGFLISWS